MLREMEHGPTCFFSVIADPPVAITNSKLVLMRARNDVECFGENVLAIDLSVIELYRLPGWYCERTGDEDGWSRARMLIGDGDG